MMEKTESAYWLALLEGENVTLATIKKLLQHWCVEDNRPLSALFEASKDAAEEIPELTREEREALLRAEKRVGTAQTRLNQLAQRGIHFFHRCSPAYPETLGDRLEPAWQPYFFFYVGNLELLTQPCLAITGAQEPTSKATQTLDNLVTRVDGTELCLLSGYRQGLERDLIEKAIENEVSAIALLPLGLERADAIVKRCQRGIDQGSALLLSPYLPDQDYSQRLARARRGLLLALSELLLLIEPDTTPDAWPLLDQFLVRGSGLLAWSSGGPLPSGWEQQGAQSIESLEELGAHLAEVIGMPILSASEGDGTWDAGLDAEPIAFADAESAIETLSRSSSMGNVPEKLAKRLRESGRFGPDVYREGEEESSE